MIVNRIRNGQEDNLRGLVAANLPKVLWQNVSRLMRKHWDEENLNRLARKGKMGPGSAQRIKAQDTSVGLEVLAKAAHALDVPAYQLLVPPEDEIAVRVIDIWNRTDDRGRSVLENALIVAEQRASGKAPGVDKTGPTNSD